MYFSCVACNYERLCTQAPSAPALKLFQFSADALIHGSG